jgi:branched-chain amino acid transport system permease protein
MVELLVTAIVSGLLVGMVYGLVGAGLNLIFGVMRVVNFAHGEFLMLAAFATYWLNGLLGMDPLVSLSVVVPLFFGLGVGMYYTTVPRLLRAEDPETASLLAYFGVALAFSGGVFAVWGAEPRGIPYPYETAFLKVGMVYLPVGRLVAFAVALVGAMGLLYFLYRTYLGKALRATIQHRQAIQLCGVNTYRLSALAFGIGIVLAGMAGTVILLVFPYISHAMGIGYTLIAFVVIMLGGLGNPLGALAGGLLYGLVENISTVFLPASMSPVVAFLVLIVIIMVRPQGLLART